MKRFVEKIGFPLLMLSAVSGGNLLFGSCSGGGAGGEAQDTVHIIPDTLRVATLYSPSSFFLFRDQRMGYDYELVTNMALEHGREIDLVVAPSLSAAVEMLDSGLVDMIAYEVPVTTEYLDHVVPCGITSVTRQVLVQPRNSKDRITDVTQLIGRDIYVERNSKYHHRLVNLDTELGGGIRIHPLDMDTLITEQVIEMVNDGKIPLTIVDSDIAKVNRTYYPGLDISVEVGLDQKSSWAVSRHTPWLADTIDTWTGEPEPRRVQAQLLRRYFEMARGEQTLYTLDLSKGHISPFDNLFRHNADDELWDWRLLASQAFVESRFDPTVVSWAGARGIMQIMPATARANGVDPSQLTDNETSISLALKIIRSLDSSLKSRVPDSAERQKFVLAAYNSGLAHIYDAIELAKVTGHDPQVWNGQVEAALLLKANPEYYNNPVCKYGYFRGRQTTEYVRSVTALYDRAKSKVKK
ncbi:MAG: transglycosylase SLT domain-containing protein [Clostridium sp.]|nr:transglycosylase SLT domain-containing protein [Clostridium sp.]